MRYWSECGNFIRECRRHFRDTGSLLPSSRFLARALVAELRRPRGPARILEVGPGTGAVTAMIVRCLQPGDELDAVELNGQFVQMLQRRLDHDWAGRPQRQQVRVLHMPIENLIGTGIYDYIVSGLPLNNFPVAQVRQIFEVFDRLLKPGGTLTYFEYALIRHLKTPFVGRREKRRLYRVGRVVGRYIQEYQVRHEPIILNVPPAIVRHLHLKPATRTSPAADAQLVACTSTEA
jgi:phospholipid N-methyltransferase